MTGNTFDTIYIPTEDDCDDFYNGTKTIEQLHKDFATRTTIVEDATDPVDIQDIPVLRETYYKESGSKDKLKAVVESTEVLVAKDINPTTGAKGFQIINWKKWIQRTTRYDMNEYECLRGTVYPYMDIESEKENIDVVEMLNVSIGCYADALLEAGVNIQSIAIANSSRPGKHSFHAIFKTDKVFESTITQHYFIQSQVKPKFTQNENTVWTRTNKKTQQIETIDCIDWKVYTTDRVIRFLNQSKMGKMVRLSPYANDSLILPCPIENTPVSFLIGHYGQVDILPIIPVQIPEHIKKVKETKEHGSVQPTIEVPVSYLNDLASLVGDEIIQNGTTCCKFIWAMVRSGASKELVHKHTSRTDNYDAKWVDYHIAHASTMNVNIGTLRYWASQYNKEEFNALSKKYMKQELTNEIHTFQTSIPVEQYSERYVRPFSFETVDTIASKSHLGTGKTTQLINAIKPQKRFLQPDHIPFKRILIISGRKSFTKFICGDLDETNLGFKAYDERHHCSLATIDRLVIQVESLWRLEDGFAKYDLVAVDESETVAHQFYSEATHRHNMIKNHIVFERCISTATKVFFADAFLGNRTIKIAEALRNIERSIVIENTFCPYERKAIQLKSIKKNKELPSISEFCNRIMADLEKGLKIAVIWGSKNKAKAFVDTLLKDSNFNHKLYSSESSPEERDELSNVEENWKYIQCLNYTSTITVGVNYDPADESVQFDKLYLYASAAGGLPRDTAQALLRCRKIKTNTLIYTVDKNALQSALYGRETIREAIADKKRKILQQNPVAKWENAPKWAEDNYIENENENGAKCIAFNDILNGYLEKSGYSLSTEVVEEDDSVDLKLDGIAFEDIDDVSNGTLESIKRKSKAGFATWEEKLILQKHRFCSQLTTTNVEQLSALWKKYMMNKGNEIVFWNMVNEKHQTTNKYIEHEATQKYIQQGSKKCLKRIALDKLLPLLGVKNSADAFSLEVSDEIVEKLKSVEEEIFTAFQKNASRRKGDFKASNAVDLLKMVYETWTGDKIETSKKRKGAGGKTVVYTVAKTANTLWEYITKKESSEEHSA